MFKVVDLETTGLRSSSEIAQIAIWTLDDKLKPVSFNNTYFRISAEMPDEAYKANKLTKKMLDELSGGYHFNDRKDTILEELMGHTLVAHNAAFEKRILSRHLDGALDNHEWICTMLRYTPTLAIPDRSGKGEFKYCNLTELTNYVLNEAGISMERLHEMYRNVTGREPSFHDALFDTYCTSFAFHILG